MSLDTWPAGNHVWIEGTDGWRTGYSHLQIIYVRTGEQVVAGQPLGLIGNTGRVAGPQLEFQAWHNGDNIDASDMLHCQ